MDLPLLSLSRKGIGFMKTFLVQYFGRLKFCWKNSTIKFKPTLKLKLCDAVTPASSIFYEDSSLNVLFE